MVSSGGEARRDVFAAPWPDSPFLVVAGWMESRGLAPWRGRRRRGIYPYGAGCLFHGAYFFMTALILVLNRRVASRTASAVVASGRRRLYQVLAAASAMTR